MRAIFGGGIPNTFVAGTVASADEVNTNFEYLKTRADQIDADIASTASLLAVSSSGSLLAPPSFLSGDTEVELLAMDVSVPSNGTVFLRLGPSIGECEESIVGELSLDGVHLTQDPFWIPQGWNKYEGITTPAMAKQTVEFMVPVSPGAHNFAFSVKNRDGLFGFIEWYHVAMSAWFVAD